jgi:hypothetical protein
MGLNCALMQGTDSTGPPAETLGGFLLSALDRPNRQPPGSAVFSCPRKGDDAMTLDNLLSKPIDPDLITREHAAVILGVGIRKLDRLSIEGRLPAPYRFNPKCVMFSKREIEAAAAAGVSMTRKNAKRPTVAA